MVEFGLDYNRPEGNDPLSPPEGHIYITNIPGEPEESKMYITPERFETIELGTYIELMIVNLNRLKKEAKKRLSAYRRQMR